ncbi:unnamed protein product [Calypogeia fissa]
MTDRAIELSLVSILGCADPSKGAKPVKLNRLDRPSSKKSRPRDLSPGRNNRATSEPFIQRFDSPPSPQDSPQRRHTTGSGRGGGPPPTTYGLRGTLTTTISGSSSPLQLSPRGGPPSGNVCKQHPYGLKGRRSPPPTRSPSPNRSPSPSRRPSSSNSSRRPSLSPSPSKAGPGRQQVTPSPSPSPSPRGADMSRRPNDVGGNGEPHDPFACTHLSELMPITPMESTYRAHSGNWQLPDGVDIPQSSEHNMRRLYVHDEDRVLLKVVHYGNATSVGIEFEENGEWQFKPLWAQRAGPRAQIYFNPAEVKAAIVTCGGLCPGLNDVIRQVVFTLDIYGVKEILGIQYGFKGFVDPKYPPITLTRKSVARVHMAGGSFIGVSRGTPDLNDIVDKLQSWGISFFFVIGGNGSHAGAHAIYRKCLERKMKIAVVGIPKTIDNDLQLVDKTFGFDTSVEEAQRAINAGFVEASSAYNGVAIVKLMGRQSGFIAMYATLASGQVDIVLIPEVPFVLDGENGVYNYMKKRLESNGLCVVVVAEGAGQDLLETSGGVDAGGNPILGDIGKWFQGQVKEFFKKIKMSVDVKYIDPTYMIRARPCNSSDHIFCSVLGQNAVHGAFAGYTDVTIGLVNTHYVFLPIPKVIEVPRMVDPNSNMWHRTVTSTGQPDFPAKKNQSYGSDKPALLPSPSNKARAVEVQSTTPQSSLGDDYNPTNDQCKTDINLY